MCTGFQFKRLSRMTLVPQNGKVVERFVIICMKNAFTLICGDVYVDELKITSTCRDVGVTACESTGRLLFLSKNLAT